MRRQQQRQQQQQQREQNQHIIDYRDRIHADKEVTNFDGTVDKTVSNKGHTSDRRLSESATVSVAIHSSDTRYGKDGSMTNDTFYSTTENNTKPVFTNTSYT
uniref:Uncharacterized protein n=1 Tax=Lygus hesperus TaxID=30085 RepID=A0A146MDD3_LYGHE